jgi:hypothetical protein
MDAQNGLFPDIRHRRESGLLIFQVPLGDILERLSARRIVAQHLRLFGAQEFSRTNLFHLRDIRRVGFAATSAALRVSPAYPPAGPVFALIYAVSFLGCLLRHRVLLRLVGFCFVGFVGYHLAPFPASTMRAYKKP